MSSLSYSTRLSLLNLDSLEMRRLKADLMVFVKLIKGFVDVDAFDFLNLLLLNPSLVAIATFAVLFRQMLLG